MLPLDPQQRTGTDGSDPLNVCATTVQKCYGRSADWWPIRHIDKALTQSLTAVASNTDRRPLPNRPLRDFDLFWKPGRVS